MPLKYDHRDTFETHVGIWRIEEELDYFRSSMYLYEHEKEEIADLSSRKLLEWYASRYLLYKMTDDASRGACVKDEYGKPFIEGSDRFISLSHSNDWIAVAGSKVAIGVDIQIIVEKITRIAHRISSPEEIAFVEGEQYILGLHILWGAKESIYKAYGKRNLEFRKHIKIDPFIPGKEVETTGSLTLEDIHMSFIIKAFKIENFVLVYAMEVDA
ncbi:MAG: 4'-phosphopantetheinyl transferase superfamily protein [Saprospiraceae bacterium]|nr:4'-phosphopantetheinyl transferase superfamily protein [Saprospiraceae bacterium]